MLELKSISLRGGFLFLAGPLEQRVTVIIWLMEFEESLLGSNYLAHGLVQKKEVTTSTVYVMSQKGTSDIIIWLMDLEESLLGSNYLARGLVQKKK